MREGGEFLTVAAAADELGVSASLIRDLIRRRELRAVVLLTPTRRSYRIRREDFEDFKRRRVRDSIDDDWE